MKQKRRVTINTIDENGNTEMVLKGADIRLPSRLIRFLFGEFQQVYLLKPGKSIASVDINTVKSRRKLLRFP